MRARLTRRADEGELAAPCLLLETRMRHLSLLAFVLSGCIVGSPADQDQPGVTQPGEDDVGDDLPGPLPAGKLAVILAHGLGGDADSFDASIVAAIEADGHGVLRTTVPGVEGVKERAAALGPQIDSLLASTGATKVHVIAHSMGGLDTRYAISQGGYAAKIASLTTISTPHQGSALADLALEANTDALDALIELVGQVDPEALDRALRDLAEANAAAFAAANPDVAGVVYQSYAGLSTPNGIDNPNAEAACGATMPPPASTSAVLLLAQPLVANGTDRIPNDAVVTVPSATYGAFQGCIPADHLAEPGAATDGFDTAAFYKGIVAKL
jgi:triacylglycerol lipase